VEHFESEREDRIMPASGFYGNLGRDTLIAPGLATWDFSTLKETNLSERMRVQFRAEIFNLLNRANFNTASLITFTPYGASPSRLTTKLP
jgi:hypothetical protein